MRRTFMGFALLVSFLTISCTETNNITTPAPGPSPVDSVAITPTSATFTARGEKQQFTAQAFDENGGQISATFTWTSSQEEVVVVGAGGLAVAAGAGNAKIFVAAGGKVDSAMVAVNVGGSTTISWAAATDGNWSDSTKWSGGAVPKAGDTAVIDLDGDYISAAASFSRISNRSTVSKGVSFWLSSMRRCNQPLRPGS